MCFVYVRENFGELCSVMIGSNFDPINPQRARSFILADHVQARKIMNQTEDGILEYHCSLDMKTQYIEKDFHLFQSMLIFHTEIFFIIAT